VIHELYQPYDRIQGQGHKTLKVKNPPFFKVHFLCHSMQALRYFQRFLT